MTIAMIGKSAHVIDFKARFSVLLGIIALLALPASAQQLNLFEEIETSNTTPEQARERARGTNRVTNSAPEFILVGTTRIGSNYSAIIQHREGDTLVVKIAPGANTQIPGHSGYAVVDVGAGQTSIRYPDNVPCVEFLERGVSCSTAANIAALSLTTGEPLPNNVAGSADRELEALANETADEAAADEPPTNPFEALRNRQENNGALGGRAGDNGRFTPRRISPEDVPPGMRVVSTPFGDRLVEQ